MELVNRETNFTKVFAGGKSGPQQPQVGYGAMCFRYKELS